MAKMKKLKETLEEEQASLNSECRLNNRPVFQPAFATQPNVITGRIKTQAARRNTRAQEAVPGPIYNGKNKMKNFPPRYGHYLKMLEIIFSTV